jgi:cellulose synthase/poly-beta-1,6-N-acetylglucosamine synthase-like glycosyltransferase
MLVVILLSLWSALLLPPIAYFIWMLKKTQKHNINTDYDYQPDVSLIVPTYNEAFVIEKKLENIQELDYPENKLQIILIDSASEDGTMEVCKAFLAKTNLHFPVTLLSEKERLGKSHALNFALKHADGEIIATSDADSFWEKNTLKKAVSYFADPSVGAVTGKEELTNLQKSVHTMSEGLYRKFYYTLRLGESIIHSTLIFQGELTLYRRTAFEEFEDKPGFSDDIGTILNIASSGYRCIFVPDAVFYDTAAYSLGGRLKVKSRRAEHLISGIVKSVRLKIKARLPIMWRVVLFNFYLHIVSPILLVATLIATTIVYFIAFNSLWFLGLLLILLLIKKARVFAVSYVTSNLALILGMIPLITGKRSSVWQKVDEMRLKDKVDFG